MFKKTVNQFCVKMFSQKTNAFNFSVTIHQDGKRIKIYHYKTFQKAEKRYDALVLKYEHQQRCNQFAIDAQTASATQKQSQFQSVSDFLSKGGRITVIDRSK